MLGFLIKPVSLFEAVIFQDNSAGCWVTRIFQDGNATRANRDGDRIEVGDQLAAVNGQSTINMTVDAVCEAISAAPEPDEIELTFLRYVGELQTLKNPAGYEITDVSQVFQPRDSPRKGKLKGVQKLPDIKGLQRTFSSSQKSNARKTMAIMPKLSEGDNIARIMPEQLPMDSSMVGFSEISTKVEQSNTDKIQSSASVAEDQSVATLAEKERLKKKNRSFFFAKKDRSKPKKKFGIFGKGKKKQQTN